MRFNRNRVRTIDCNLSAASINTLKTNWENYVESLDPYPVDKYKGKGIVYTAGGIGYVSCLWVSVNMLRKTGCTLPIEVWHLANEISDDVKTIFFGLNVSFRDFNEISKISETGFHLKPLAILNSSFEEVLYIDTDNICIRDPISLFNLSNYQKTGTVFWPDYWLTDASNPIWKITGAKFSKSPEQESGQLIINKKYCWRELNLCIYFNALGKYYYKLLYGDKDTFKFAWLALGSKYYMIDKFPSTCGLENNGFIGNTMIQYDENSEILFLHRNLFKWDITLSGEKVWAFMKSFKESALVQEVLLQQRSGLTYIDFQGDFSMEDSPLSIKLIEESCLIFLDQWRSSEQYFRFYEHLYMRDNRKLTLAF